MATIDVKDAAGATVTVAKIAATGSAADANSLPFTQSTEDKAVLAALSAKLPASVGSKADAASLAVTQSTEDKAKTPASLGSKAAASSFAVTASTEDIARVGIITETAPASDTASSGLNGRTQRVAQNVTTMSAKLPAALGQTTKSASMSVALASDDSLLSMVTAPSTGTQSNVSSSATDVTVLASNTARKGAYVYNDSTQVLYLLLSNATSSATVFTQKLAAGDAFSMTPGTYTGVIKGIWASANGSARVTEWS